MVPRIRFIFRLISILWILLVSYSPWPPHRRYILRLCSRSRYRNPRNRRLDNTRAAYYCPRSGRNQPHRCGHRRGLSGVRYKCWAVDYVSLILHPNLDWQSTNGTCLDRAAADVLYEIMTMMVKKGPLSLPARNDLWCMMMVRGIRSDVDLNKIRNIALANEVIYGFL